MTNLRQASQQALEALAIADNIALVGAAYTPKSIDLGLRKIRDSATALRTALEQQQAEPSQWRDMVVVSLVREGVNKHKARELADHFAAQQQAEPLAWTSVTKALPKSGVVVLACYRNRLGNLRRIRAMWTAAKTEEADSDDAHEEYDEATDTYYVPEGWYECIDNWGDYSSVAVTEGEVTHWMPLPQPPIEAAHGIKEGT